jgi:predicted metal-binding membrane protein
MFTAAHLRSPRRDRAILGAALGALVLAAWLTLVLWERSPYGAYLHHAGGVGPLPFEAALFAVGWVLMIVAMMLPSSVPLVMTFAALVRRRRHAGRLVVLLLAGYLLVWGAFGLAATGASTQRSTPSRGSPSTRRSSSPRHSRRPACGSSARCATAAWTSAAARSASSSIAGAARPSASRRSGWASLTVRSASDAAGR